MIAAIDSNVLFDVLVGEPGAALSARRAIDLALASGRIVVCPVVYAEVSASFADPLGADRFMTELRAGLDPFTSESLQTAAVAWRAYTRQRGEGVECPRCGHRSSPDCPGCGAPLRWRQHIIADFLVGGHAADRADLLLTRDRGYYRRYFPRLRIWLPGEPRPD